MDVTGTVYKVLPARTGISQQTGKEWTVQPFILEYYENPNDQRFADRVLLEATKLEDGMKIVEGAEVRVVFGHNVRDYKNKDGVVQWFNTFHIFRIDLIRMPGEKPAEPTIQPPLSPAPTQEPPKEAPADGSDLPF